jgi:hypothetical protein
MDMNEALQKMVEGKKMVRPGWTEDGDRWLEMRQSDPPKLPLLENAYLKTKENTYVAWSGSVDDITATDWEERVDPATIETPPGEKPPPGSKPPLGGEGKDIGRADKDHSHPPPLAGKPENKGR